MSERRNFASIAFLIALLIVCNIAFFAFTGLVHFVYLLFAYAGLFCIFRFSKLNLANIGLELSNLQNGLKCGAIFCAAIFCLLLAAYFVNHDIFRDPRYHQSVSSAFISVIFIEPIKIILFEEIAFRGLMLAQFLRVFNKSWHAIVATSVIFGLWHILPSLHFGNSKSHTISILSSVIFTTLAGIALAELRLRSKSLTAPILVHWFVNGSAIILAAFSW